MDDVISEINSMDTVSIYSENRLALPDEVWNYRRGDGIEKAVLLANVIKNRDPDSKVTITISEGVVELDSGDIAEAFETSKNLSCRITL